MGKRNLRLGGYKADQAAAARRRRELASKKQAEEAAAKVKEKAPADATPVREAPYDRLLRKLREGKDRAGVEKRGEEHGEN
jgi:hypothetical protein